MKLSVSIVVFNQEGFIAQCLDGVLAQQTDFDFEIIVGDDASTDGTRAILEAYRARHPDKIKLLLPEKNYGDRGLSNFMSTVDASTGDYIAFLDGDDYWTAPDKLQRQVEFLDRHPECALCAHRVQHLLEGGEVYLSPRPAHGDAALPVSDLLVRNFAEKIATVVRRPALESVPDWYRTTSAVSADWVFNVLAARDGAVGYVDEVMAVHRLHRNSQSVRQGLDRMLADKLNSIDLVRPYLPAGSGTAVWRARSAVRLRRVLLRLFPWGYTALKRLGAIGYIPTRPS